MKDIKDAYMAGLDAGFGRDGALADKEGLWAEYEAKFYTDPPIHLSLDEIWNCTKSISGFKTVADAHGHRAEDVLEYVNKKKKGQHL